MTTTRLATRSREELLHAASGDERVALHDWESALARGDGLDRPVLVSLLEDWASFSGLSYPEMITRCRRGQEDADRLWHERTREHPEDVARYYDESEAILPLLLWWHGTSVVPARCAAAALRVARSIGARFLLDFGSGIGSTALVAARDGLAVTLTDVSRALLEFSAHRFEERGLEPARVLNLRETGLDELEPASMDAVVAFDVFEHLPSTTAVISSLDRALSDGGVLCFNQVFLVESADEPEHYAHEGEVLLDLHHRGYRLAHLRDVMWVAQKRPLAPRSHKLQAAEIAARIAAAKAGARITGSFLGGIGSRALRYSVR